MSFARDMQRFVDKARGRTTMLHDACIGHVYASITVGSSITGAPGQPVKSGDLLKSWKVAPGGRRATTRIYSDSPYADIIEDNKRGAVLRSSVGGFHSVKMTRIGWRALVAHELRRVKSSGNAHLRFTAQRDVRGRFAPSRPTDVTVSGG